MQLPDQERELLYLQPLALDPACFEFYLSLAFNLKETTVVVKFLFNFISVDKGCTPNISSSQAHMVVVSFILREIIR